MHQGVSVEGAIYHHRMTFKETLKQRLQEEIQEPCSLTNVFWFQSSSLISNCEIRFPG